MKTQEKNTEHMLAMPDLSFPWRLFLLLKYAEEEQLEQIITWTRGGKAFQVHNHEEFERTLLPKYFKMSKYASFTRQLCAYGFSCIRRGRQKGLFFHSNFVRDDPNGCFQISRKTKKNSKTSRSTENHSAPGDYASSSPSLASIESSSSTSSSSKEAQSYKSDYDHDDDDVVELYKNMQKIASGTFLQPDLLPRQLIEPTTPGSCLPSYTSQGLSLGTGFPESIDELEPLPLEPPIDLEPRKIEDMLSAPDTSIWYGFCPTMSPKQQALMEYTLPLVLSGIAYSMRFTNFGHIWCILIISGHTIETMFTSFGSSARSLSYKPVIGPLHHHFIDCMWLHTLISAMLLMPQRFGDYGFLTGLLLIQTLPIYLAVSLKTHFTVLTSANKRSSIQSMDRVIQNLFCLYFGATLFSLFGHLLGNFDLTILGVFLFNASPVITGETYIQQEFYKTIV